MAGVTWTEHIAPGDPFYFLGMALIVIIVVWGIGVLFIIRKR